MVADGRIVAIGLFDQVKRTFRNRGGEEEQLDQPTLHRKVVAGILELRHRGHRGVDVLPPAVTVHVRVGKGSAEVVERIVDDPAFDADVDADLRNRLVGGARTSLPVRHYRVEAAAKTSVEVEETADDTLLWLEIEGGDHDGEWLPFKASIDSYRVGRGPWHGPEDTLSNELVVSDHDTFVSRRAALLRRAGASLEIESLDQDDCLFVVRGDGKRVRPTHVPSRRVRVQAGDAIELTDGGQQAVRVRLHRRRPENGG